MNVSVSFPRSTEQQDKSLIGHGSDSGKKKKVGDEAPPRDGLTLLTKALALLCFCGLALSVFQLGCKFNVLGLRNSFHNPYHASPTTSDVSIPKNLRDVVDDDYDYETMVEFDWDDNNEVSIEFCYYRDPDGNELFGYRLPSANNQAANCGPAGLVIRMAPGNNYTLTLNNTASSSSGTIEADEVTTNIHTHGLHISGDGNADDVTREVEQESCIKYHWNIPSDHMGGTHWMHGHMDDNVEDQVLQGAYAMVIIEENDELLQNVADNADKAALARWMENELLLISAKGSGAYLGNGKNGEDNIFQMIPGEWYRLRTLSIQKKATRIALNFPASCDVYPVAWDGVWTFQTPGSISNNYNPTGAGRLDVAIRCTENGDITFGGSNKVATIKVESKKARSIASPFLADGSQWQPGRPHYLRDLTGENADNSDVTITLGSGGLNINGGANLEKLFDIEYGTINQWQISGASGHPFHLHVFHMQVQSGCNGHEVGEYYDTISPSTSIGPACNVRFHIGDFAGRIVMHCHNIGHEDSGMIVWFNATNGPPVETSDDMYPYQCTPVHGN